MKLLFLHITFVFLLLGTRVSSQDYTIDYLSTEKGLSQNEVTSIIQDKKGFMWFGTRGGLNRFDGYEFTQFKSRANESQGLSNPSVECVFKDFNGRIWIGTKSGGIDIYHPEKSNFTHLDNSNSGLIQLSGNRIITISQTSDSLMLLGSWLNGLTIWDNKTDSVNYILPEHKISCIQEDKNGILWIGTNHGLYEYNIKSDKLEHHNFQNEYFNINEFVLDEDRDIIWIASWQNGLVRYNPKTRKYVRSRIKTENAIKNRYAQNSYSLLLTEQGQVYVGTWGGGLYLFNPETETFKSVSVKPENLGEFNNDFDIILDLYKASSDEIWVGTDGGGICRIGARPAFDGVFLRNKRGSELRNYHILSILNTNENQLWIGTKGGGLYYSNNRKDFFGLNNLVSESNLEQFTIKCFFQDDLNQIWVGSNLGLQKIEKQDTKYNLVDFDQDNKWWDIRKVSAIYKSDQVFLVGTQQNGLFDIFETLQNDTVVKNFSPKNNSILKNRRITFIKKDSHSRIWVGTYNGLYFYDIQEKEFKEINLQQNSAFPSQIVLSWNQKNDSCYFIGTPSGLTQLTEKTNNLFATTNYYKEDGLPDDYIHAILADNNKNLWISTNLGISCFNSETLSFRNYDESDGLQGKSFSEGCGFASDNNELFFGGINGFNFFNPNNIVDNTTIPKIILTGFSIESKPIKTGDIIYKRQILNQDISYTTKIKLPYQVNEFSFTFAALCFDAPVRNNYAYRLVDVNNKWIGDQNNNWINNGNKRTVSFNKLKAGTYVFEVIGSNNHNVWNKDPLRLEIKVNPAPWKTWYAIILYVFLIILIVLLIRWNAIKQVRLANSLEIEKVQHEQEQVLHEMKLRFFTNISHEFRTPLTLILGPIQEILDENSDNRRVKIIYKNARRLMGLVNQLLEFRRVETDTLRLKASKNNVVDFVREVCISFEELAKINQIEFQTELNLKSKYLWFDIEKMEIVLNNLIANAFKYAGSGAKIEVVLSESKEDLSFHVVDNGLGINKKDIDSIFDRFYESHENSKLGSTGIGLNLVKRMVELHQGGISVKSTPNVKTEFVVHLKKGEKHFTDNEKIKTSAVQPSFISTSGMISQLKTSDDNTPTDDDKNKSLLIVEDNPELREYLQTLFEKRFKVSLADNGKMGYEKAIENEFDLIISDVLMPEMDGLEMCKLLKTNLETSHIPLILLTAKSASQFRLEGLTHGAEAYISKPFNPDELKIQVNSILAAREKVKEKFGKTITLEPTELEITSLEEDFIERVIKGIEDNIDNSEFTSEDLASLVGTSTTTLYRKLKSLTGQSSNEIIRSIRLKRAAQLLKESQNTISEITYMVGFNDVKYFRKCFQKQFNSTPSGFRNAHKNK